TYVPSAQQPLPVPRDETGYGMPALVDPGAALAVSSGPHQAVGDGGVPFELDGYDQLSVLDENVQGRRYRVRERASGAKFRALVLNPQLVRQPGYAGQVESYARMASQVKHPQVLSPSAIRQGRDTPIILSQEPSDHEALTHVLARRRTLAPPHALDVARQIALGLEEASRHGVVHGWLRPDVILLSPDGNLVIDEVGVAKHHRYLVRELSGASAATEYYLAPEHLSDETRSDVRSDIFMLGALMFRMITGEGLITGYTAHEALHKIAANGCRTARSTNPSISRDLDGFIARLCAVERRDRFQTWQEVIDVVERFGGGAKRQTLRLTQPVSSGTGRLGQGGTGTIPRSGSGTVSRPGSGGIQRSGSGGIPRQAGTARIGPSSGYHSRPVGEDGAVITRRVTRKESSPAGLIVVLVVVLALAAAAVVALMNNGRQQPPPSRPRSTTATSPPAATAPKTPTRTPESPIAAKPPAGGVLGPNSKLPTTLTPGAKATAAGATPPVAAPEPTVAAPTAPGLTGSEGRGELLARISEFERAERFQDALALCAQLSSDEERQARRDDVMGRHQARRAQVESQVLNAGDMTTVRNALAPAQDLWKVPGDAEWAQHLLTISAARLGDKTAPAPTVAASGAATPAATAPPAGAPSNGKAAETSWAVDQALAKNQILIAEQALATLAKDVAEVAPIQRKIDIWRNRTEILGAIISERRPKLRVTSPSDGQLWDVVGVEAAGLTVQSAAGSSTRLDWPQVPAKDIGRLCQEAANTAKAPVAREQALAVVMLLLGGDTSLASVQFIKNKAAFDAGLARDLDTLIALRKSFEAIALLQRADEAAKGDSPRALEEALEPLRRDKSPEVVAALPALEERLKSMQGKGSEGVSAAQLKDSLTFDCADDLAALPGREGAWTVAGGMLAAPVEGSPQLVRKDLATGRALTVLFQNAANRGAMTVNFRGVRVLIELTRNTVTVQTSDQNLKPVDFTFAPRTVHSLYIELRGKDQALVEINNGVISLDVKSGHQTDLFALKLDTGAQVSFDEITFSRDQRLDPATEAARVAAIRNLGFEPIGSATLAPPMIVLPMSTPRSGLAYQLRDGVVSMTIEAKGTGKLEARFGKLGQGGGRSVTLDLGGRPDAVVKYTIGWSGGMATVRNANGEVIIEDKLDAPPTHVMIVATQEATIISTPKLNRQ
ncbi:MAG: protein kinase, partial [Planctomycetes bacterium]|nr:protein kinase [Planctomycetota bacterium]